MSVNGLKPKRSQLEQVSVHCSAGKYKSRFRNQHWEDQIYKFTRRWHEEQKS